MIIIAILYDAYASFFVYSADGEYTFPLFFFGTLILHLVFGFSINILVAIGFNLSRPNVGRK